MFFSGQHMLRETESFHALLEKIELKGRTVIEVGVGTGVLTRMILERGPQLVVGYEIDPSICALSDPRFVLNVGDFRVAKLPLMNAQTCLISAPPYGLIGDLLAYIAGEPALIEDVILMVPHKRLRDLPGFHVEFVLPHTAFEPHTDPGLHYVVRRGFDGVVPT